MRLQNANRLIRFAEETFSKQAGIPVTEYDKIRISGPDNAQTETLLQNAPPVVVYMFLFLLCLCKLCRYYAFECAYVCYSVTERDRYVVIKPMKMIDK